MTGNFLHYLVNREERACRLGQTLMDSARTMDLPEVLPVCSALEKIARVSETFASYCMECFHAPGRQTHEISVGVTATRFQNDKEFFAEVKRVGSSLRYACEAAAYAWSSDGRDGLLDAIEDLADPSRLQEVEGPWGIWCERSDRSIAEAFGDVRELVERFSAARDEDGKLLYEHLTSFTLRTVLIARRPEALHGAVEQLLAAQYLSEHAGESLAGEIAKWTAYAFSPELVRTDVKWVVQGEAHGDKKRFYAMPVHPYEPQYVGVIQARVFSQECFSLPCKDNLRDLPPIPPEGPELVADGFPPKFRGEYALMPADYQYVMQDGATACIERHELQTRTFSWRPRLYFHKAEEHVKQANAREVEC